MSGSAATTSSHGEPLRRHAGLPNGVDAAGGVDHLRYPVATAVHGSSHSAANTVGRAALRHGRTYALDLAPRRAAASRPRCGRDVERLAGIVDAGEHASRSRGSSEMMRAPAGMVQTASSTIDVGTAHTSHSACVRMRSGFEIAQQLGVERVDRVCVGLQRCETASSICAARHVAREQVRVRCGSVSTPAG